MPTSREVQAQMSENKRKFGFETRMLHAGHIPDPHVGARAVPIYQTTSYVFNDAEQAAQLFDLKLYGNIYTRLSNPTTAVFEERVASLENGTGAVAVASGMAAQFAVFMTLLEPGDEIVASAAFYGGSVTQLAHTLKKLSIAVHFVDPGDLKAWEAAVTPKTRALFGEIIGNPGGSILDLEALAGLADSRHIPLIVDSTFATPYLCRPIDWGATIVTHSATKFLGGHGNSIGGVVIDSGKFNFARFPTIADPSPSYHGLRFFDTFGHYGFSDEAADRDAPRHGGLHFAHQQLPPDPGAGDALVADGTAREQRGGRGEVPRRACEGRTRELRRSAGKSLSRAGLQVSAQGTGRGVFLRPQVPRRQRPRGGQAIHRIASALFSPGQRGRRPQPGDPSGVDHPPTA